MLLKRFCGLCPSPRIILYDMHPTTYYGYYGYGYGPGYWGWTPYATYPHGPQTTAPCRYPILVPLQDVAQHLPPHPFGAALGYHQQDTSTLEPQRHWAQTPWYPWAQIPWYYYQAQRPAPRDDDAPMAITRAPWRSRSPDRTLPERIPWHPWIDIDRDTRSHTQLTVDPILALPAPPFGTLGFQWDLADNPVRAILDRPENGWIRWRDLTRAAVRDGARALERLVLVFKPALRLPRERDAQIGVTHTHPATRLGADEDVAWVTVYDVFMAIFQWLVSPIGEAEMRRLGDGRFEEVIRTAEARRRGRAGRAGTVGREPYLKVDYLGERRRFKGIRLGVRDEVPVGRRLGEVFVIELGASV
ncbi:hypothetical protein GSI_14359 [Ganoderma sinense ZZ0214-1]|uniref:DUF6699 domain-containing protein n=1 Tax=Ganoderma sinense ZZ0214-1 TaxID=1077348 RepID=A0A2G8RNF2_9APHY|nr:hypothetical protein GSI_14359 [Ganoderma sinense ZZ0214-1]